MAHVAMRIRLGRDLVPVIAAYGVACTFTYDYTHLLLNGKMTIARFALQLGVDEDTARTYVNKLCCLGLMSKYFQREVLPADWDPEHANAVALYVNHRLPPWVYENVEILQRLRNSDGQARQRIGEELREHQHAVIAEMERELRRKIKMRPKRIPPSK